MGNPSLGITNLLSVRNSSASTPPANSTNRPIQFTANHPFWRNRPAPICPFIDTGLLYGLLILRMFWHSA